MGEQLALADRAGEVFLVADGDDRRGDGDQCRQGRAGQPETADALVAFEDQTTPGIV
jgi:hypothetical protein